LAAIEFRYFFNFMISTSRPFMQQCGTGTSHSSGVFLANAAIFHLAEMIAKQQYAEEIE